jgi:hypothetical protein
VVANAFEQQCQALERQQNQLSHRLKSHIIHKSKQYKRPKPNLLIKVRN